VIGHDGVDPVPAQPFPKRSAVAGLADRGRALELGGTVGDLLRLEGQVVRARLDGHAIGAVEQVEAGGSRQMKDMSAAACFRARRDHGLDGALLALGTTGMQVGLVPVEDVVRSIERHRDVPQQLGQLCVHDQETVERGDLLHRRTQLPEIEHRELVHARRA
jgi:hypothetical protein